NAVINAKLDHFRVDEQKFYFLWGGVVKNADNQGVDADRFTGTGRTGNQSMRHLCQIGNRDFAGNIASQSNSQRAFCLLKFRRINDFADRDSADHLVWNLNADSRFVWNWSFDADTRSGKV